MREKWCEHHWLEHAEITVSDLSFHLRRSPPPFPEFSTALRMPDGRVFSSFMGVDRVSWTEMKEAGLKGGMLHPVAQTAAGEFVVEWQLVLPSTGALPDEPSSTPAPRDPSCVTDPWQLSRLV